MPSRLAVSANETPYSLISFKAIGGYRIEAWQPLPFPFCIVSLSLL
jgi:hypothetical protein